MGKRGERNGKVDIEIERREKWLRKLKEKMDKERERLGGGGEGYGLRNEI